jgi:uncharacterized membrane protein HdeD (DUF308 family)
MAAVAASPEQTLADDLPPWWLLLVTGVGWMLVGIVLLRFDYTSVRAISLLFGFIAIAAGVMEIGLSFITHGWWRALNIVLAVAFLISGIVAFIHPGSTFAALAGVFSFFLLFAGIFDIIQAIGARNEISVWWLTLVGGIIEILLAFWAAGYYGRSSVLLVAWAAAFVLIRGIRDIVMAFRVRAIEHGADV